MQDMKESFWERDARVTKEYLRREAVSDYIEEFGLKSPEDLTQNQKIKHNEMVSQLAYSIMKIDESLNKHEGKK